MAEQDNSLFRELDEEMRREQFVKLWKQYGTYIIAVAAALPLGVGGYQIYLHQKQASIEAAGAAFDAAAQLATGGKLDDARAGLDKIAKGGPAGYATLARLRLASADAKAGKTAEAIATFEAIGKDGSTDKMLGDFAKLQAASLRVDQADWTEMQNRLIELTDNANPWRFQAREMMGLAALKNGQIEQARKFNELLLGERNLPPAILERVNIMLATITATELAVTTPPAAVPAAMSDTPKVELPKTPEPKAAEEKKKN
jgi:hypothetical protein